jgi:hypothetical protein
MQPPSSGYKVRPEDGGSWNVGHVGTAPDHRALYRRTLTSQVCSCFLLIVNSEQTNGASPSDRRSIQPPVCGSARLHIPADQQSNISEISTSDVGEIKKTGLMCSGMYQFVVW